MGVGAMHFYLSLNEEVDPDAVDVAVREHLASESKSATAPNGDTVLHSLCRNGAVSAKVLAHALGKGEFAALCTAANAVGEDPLMCFLKTNRSLLAVPE